MKWNIPIHSQNNYPVRVGYSFEGTHHEYPYSYLNLRASNISSTKYMLENIDGISEHASLLSGVKWNDIDMKMSKKGKLGFKLTNNGIDFKHHGILCNKWINADKNDLTNAINMEDAATCPCVKSQMIDTLFHKLSNARIPIGYDCFITASAALAVVDPRSKRCCYDIKGQLITDHTVVNGMNTYQRHSGNVQDMDDKTYDSCCKSDYSNYLKTSLCEQFLLRRPVSTCGDFESSSVGKILCLLKLN